MKINTDNIVAFKMNNGIELIGELVSENDHTFEVNKALFFELVPVDENKADIAMYPVSAALDGDEGDKIPITNVTLQKTSVMFTFVPRMEIKERYKGWTSSIVLM